MANGEYFAGKHSIPPTVRQSERIKTEFGALEENQTLNTGMITRERNLSADAYPYLTPVPKWVKWGDDVKLVCGDTISDMATGAGDIRDNGRSHYSRPDGLFGFRDCLIVAHRQLITGTLRDECYFDILMDKIGDDQYGLRIHYIGAYKFGNESTQRLLSAGNMRYPNAIEMTRAINAYAVESIASHFVFTAWVGRVWEIRNWVNEALWVGMYRNIRLYDQSGSTVLGNIGSQQEEIYAKINIGTGGTGEHDNEIKYETILDRLDNGGNIYKTQYSYDAFCGNGDPAYGNGGIMALQAKESKPARYYTVGHNGRIFSAGLTYTEATDYASLETTLDTAGDYHESHGWESLLSAKGDTGDVTGICSYGGHVVVFKKGYMHEIRNTKNPFRVVDIGAVGCVDYRSICEVDGVLFFVAEDGVYAYTGNSLPKLISSPLRIKKWDKAVAGANDHKLYMYGESGEEKVLYVYDTQSGVWCEEDAPGTGIMNFARTDFGFFYMTGGGEIYRRDDTYTGQEWFFETDLYTNARLDNKRVRKVELYGDFSQDASVKVYLLRHDETFGANSRKVYENTFTAAKRASIRVPIRNTGGEGYKLRVEGTGYAKIYHMITTVETDGSKFKTE